MKVCPRRSTAGHSYARDRYVELDRSNCIGIHYSGNTDTQAHGRRGSSCYRDEPTV